MGYEPIIMQNIELSSGKELILNLELQESVMMEEVVIEAEGEKEKRISEPKSVVEICILQFTEEGALL